MNEKYHLHRNTTGLQQRIIHSSEVSRRFFVGKFIFQHLSGSSQALELR